MSRARAHSDRGSSAPCRRAGAVAACLVLGAVLLVGMFAGGCNYLIPAAYLIEGPPKEPARYELPRRKTVVYVDDRTNRMTRAALRAAVGEEVGTLILQQALVPEVVSTKDAVAYARRADSSDKQVSIRRIGEAVGAEQVIYIDIDEYRISADGATPRPAAIVNVKVIDVGSGARLWPDGTDTGERMVVRTREQSLELYNSSAGRRRVEDALAKQVAEDVSKLFYEHEKRELGGNLGIRN
jgi:hypothetical protein